MRCVSVNLIFSLTFYCETTQKFLLLLGLLDSQLGNVVSMLCGWMQMRKGEVARFQAIYTWLLNRLDLFQATWNESKLGIKEKCFRKSHPRQSSPPLKQTLRCWSTTGHFKDFKRWRILFLFNCETLSWRIQSDKNRTRHFNFDPYTLER